MWFKKQSLRYGDDKSHGDQWCFVHGWNHKHGTEECFKLKRCKDPAAFMAKHPKWPRDAPSGCELMAKEDKKKTSRYENNSESRPASKPRDRTAVAPAALNSTPNRVEHRTTTVVIAHDIDRANAKRDAAAVFDEDQEAQLESNRVEGVGLAPPLNPSGPPG